MPLTQAELDFFTHYNVETLNFHLPTPAHELVTAHGFQSAFACCRVTTFQHVWQEQSKESGLLTDFYSYLGDYSDFPYPPLTFPWSTPEQFLARWRELCPESERYSFYHGRHPYNYYQRLINRDNPASPYYTPPFTMAESQFLDALYDEIRSAIYGPCFQAANELHLDFGNGLNVLVGYRGTLLMEQGLPWPQPYPASPPIPWPTKEFFEKRFDFYFAPACRSLRTKGTPLGDAYFTKRERIFMDHHFCESWTSHPGPANAWLGANSIHPVLLIPFQRRAHADPQLAERVLLNRLDPFVVPWATKEVFFTRCRVFLNSVHQTETVKDLVTKYLPPEEESYMVTASV